jgi:hypothetical protein
MIKLLITTFIEVLNNQKEYSIGQLDEDILNSSYKRFSTALNEYIHYNFELFDHERRIKSGHDRVSIADTINTSIKSTASSVRSMSALSSAPTPPINIHDLDLMEEWIKDYDDWYKNQRENAITIK